MALLTSLMAWWKLDEAANNDRLDSSGNGKTLRDIGGNVAQSAGLIGNSAGPYSLASLKTAAKLISNDGFSISFWFKRSADVNAILVGQTPDASTGLRFVKPSTSVKWNAGAGTNCTTAALSLNVWHHIVGTFDGNRAKLYSDGVLVDSQIQTGNYTGTLFTAGGDTADANLLTNGSVDLLGVWSRVIDDGGVGVGTFAGGEVAQLYNAGIGLDYPFTLQAPTIKVAASASGNNVVISAIPNYAIRVTGYVLSFSNAVNAQWQQDDGTNLIGLIYDGTTVPGTVVAPLIEQNARGWFQTAKGQGLYLNLSGAVAVGGHLQYELVG